MPLYMDVHRNMDGVTLDDVVQAHQKDVEVQQEYGVCYHKFWVNEDTGRIFCLVEGPNKEACAEVHRVAHGLVANEIIEVDPAIIEGFLGDEQPNEAGSAVTPDGTPDRGFRIVLFTEVANFAEIAQRRGDAAALEVVREHDRIARAALDRNGGHEVRHNGDGMLISFASASAALRFAADMQQECSMRHRDESTFRPQLRIGMAAGEPVEAADHLFGVSVATARRICDLAKPGEVVVSAAVRELAVGKGFTFDDRGSAQLKDIAEPVVLHTLHVTAQQASQQAQRKARERKAAAAPVGGARGFVAELRRRGVITVGVVYAGVLFVLLQVAELTFTPLGLPEWAYKLVLVLGIFGFPLAIVLSWIFDVSGGSVTRTTSD